MKRYLILSIGTISLLLLCSTADAKISREVVNRAWKKIAAADNFPVLPMNYERDEEANAWVAYEDDGSYSVHVTAGLMRILKTEDEIAGVLGHELGHIQLGHYNSFAINDTVRIMRGGNLDDDSDLMAQAVGNIDLDLRESKFSREQETEADNYGVKILVKAGYDPKALYNAMKRFDDTEENGFNSHPASRERLANLLQQANLSAGTEKYKSETKTGDEIDELVNVLMGL